MEDGLPKRTQRLVRAPRLTLEPQVAAHAEAMFAVLADPAIYEFENVPPVSLEALRERYARLESRRSPEGGEAWLNWVLRLPSGDLAGFVQATVHADGVAAIAYVLGTAWWGRGLAGEAVRAMLAELAAHHGARRYTAVLKRRNERSMRLLQRLGFRPATAQEAARAKLEADEVLWCRGLREPFPGEHE